ncbi:MAG: hypothetical protein EU547_01550 [Promethearchaeota archaeon]|nr:MAG: hypothetical protein EU547_01550 [Candidatus Lokiarchaeota archaeon]
MKIRLGSMIFFGIVKALFYLVVPLVAIYFLNNYTVLTVSEGTIIGIIILGSIGTAITVLNHTFQKETVASGYTSIIDSIWSAIFLFYVFGGFSLGDGFGYYSVDGDILGYYISAQIGLQIIAYLLMIGAGIQVFRHIFRTIEFSKHKKYDIKFKEHKFRASTLFRILGVLVNLGLIIFIISIPVSALMVDINLEGGGPTPIYDDNGTPQFDDDTMNISLQFSVDNNGIYSILDVRLDIDILVRDCINGSGATTIADNTIIATTPDKTYNFLKGTSVTSENFTIVVLPAYVAKLAVSNATLVFDISFEARYAQLTGAVNVMFEQEWSNETI